MCPMFLSRLAGQVVVEKLIRKMKFTLEIITLEKEQAILAYLNCQLAK